jgi:hypothetical protein
MTVKVMGPARESASALILAGIDQLGLFGKSLKSGRDRHEER